MAPLLRWWSWICPCQFHILEPYLDHTIHLSKRLKAVFEELLSFTPSFFQRGGQKGCLSWKVLLYWSFSEIFAKILVPLRVPPRVYSPQLFTYPKWGGKRGYPTFSLVRCWSASSCSVCPARLAYNNKNVRMNSICLSVWQRFSLKTTSSGLGVRLLDFFA